MKTDYTFEIRKLISDNFEPVESEFKATDYTEKKTLSDIYKMVTSILPKDWVYESDIYGILEELGFKSFLYTEPPILDEEGEEKWPARTSLCYFMEKKTASV